MMNILDGVKSVEIKISKEVISLSETVKDESLSLVDRLEAFEDIIEDAVARRGIDDSQQVVYSLHDLMSDE